MKLMRVFLIGISLVLFGQSFAAELDWNKLLNEKRFDEARLSCREATTSSKVESQVEGYKCLANLVLDGNDAIVIERNDVGGGVLRSGYKNEQLDNSIAYLEKALKLKPDDLSLHRGRMHLLVTNSRIDQAKLALQNSLSTYSGSEKNDLDIWLPYPSMFFERNQLVGALEISKVLMEKFPNQYKLQTNLGAIYAMLKRDDEALIHIKQAAEMNPEDDVNIWNLARLYDFTGKYNEADVTYSKALNIMKRKNISEIDLYSCTYAKFIADKLNDKNRACLQSKNKCAADGLVCN
jgi:tetratricopeptide (TPR) repeat protein